MRTRLRPVYSAAELATLYAEPFDHTWHPQHVERIAATAELGHTVTPVPRSIADLACGDGVLPRALARWSARHWGTAPVLILGDLYPRWPVVGPIEATVDEIEPVEVFVLSEAIEHLDDPDAVLGRIRAHWLLLSTPIGEVDPALNPEHYWGWDIAGVRELLEGTGWTPRTMRSLRPRDGGVYTFQLWLAERPGFEVSR